MRTFWERQGKGCLRFWAWIGHRLVPERLWLWWVLTRMVFSKSYGTARVAVRMVATDLELYAKMQKDWRQTFKEVVLSHSGSSAGENVIRQAEARIATSLWLRGFRVTLSPSERNALVEVAYFTYKQRGR